MDVNTLEIMLTKVAIFVPVTTGVVQVIKIAGFPTRFLPLLAVILGSVLGWFVVAASAIGIFAGAAIGLASVGLFEFGRTTVVGQ